MSVNALRMDFDRSCRTCRLTDEGSCACSVGSSARIAAVHLDDVQHFRLALHRHVDGAPAAVLCVEPCGIARVFDAVEHGGDLIEPDGAALPVRHDDRLEFVSRVQLAASLDVERLVRAEQPGPVVEVDAALASAAPDRLR